MEKKSDFTTLDLPIDCETVSNTLELIKSLLEKQNTRINYIVEKYSEDICQMCAVLLRWLLIHLKTIRNRNDSNTIYCFYTHLESYLFTLKKSPHLQSTIIDIEQNFITSLINGVRYLESNGITDPSILTEKLLGRNLHIVLLVRLGNHSEYTTFIIGKLFDQLKLNFCGSGCFSGDVLKDSLRTECMYAFLCVLNKLLTNCELDSNRDLIIGYLAILTQLMQSNNCQLLNHYVDSAVKQLQMQLNALNLL